MCVCGRQTNGDGTVQLQSGLTVLRMCSAQRTELHWSSRETNEQKKGGTRANRQDT